MKKIKKFWDRLIGKKPILYGVVFAHIDNGSYDIELSTDVSIKYITPDKEKAYQMAKECCDSCTRSILGHWSVDQMTMCENDGTFDYFYQVGQSFLYGTKVVEISPFDYEF